MLELQGKFDSVIETITAIDSNFTDILELIGDYGESHAFIAGGLVRNAFLSEDFKPKDADLFISEAIFDPLFKLLSQTGKIVVNPFGSLRWHPDPSVSFYYDVIVIEKFYNGLWPCENITDVLNQFDFTANAIAFDLKTGQFYNPSNGLLHLERKELRAVRLDFPEINLSDDIALSRNAILWFRIQHYAKKLGFTIEPITRKWLEQRTPTALEKEMFSALFFTPLT
jgi:tRNA nucleotidyltransferase/poly(A) polymerase